MRVLLLFIMSMLFISGETPCVVHLDKNEYRIYTSDYLLCKCRTIRTIRDTAVLRQLFEPEDYGFWNLTGLVSKSKEGWELYQYWTVSSHTYVNKYYLRKEDQVIITPDAEHADSLYMLLIDYGFSPKKSRKISAKVERIEKAYEAAMF